MLPCSRSGHRCGGSPASCTASPTGACAAMRRRSRASRRNSNCQIPNFNSRCSSVRSISGAGFSLDTPVLTTLDQSQVTMLTLRFQSAKSGLASGVFSFRANIANRHCFRKSTGYSPRPFRAARRQGASRRAGPVQMRWRGLRLGLGSTTSSLCRRIQWK